MTWSCSIIIIIIFFLQIEKAVLFGTAGYCTVVFFNYSVSLLMSQLMIPVIHCM